MSRSQSRTRNRKTAALGIAALVCSAAVWAASLPAGVLAQSEDPWALRLTAVAMESNAAADKEQAKALRAHAAEIERDLTATARSIAATLTAESWTATPLPTATPQPATLTPLPTHTPAPTTTLLPAAPTVKEQTVYTAPVLPASPVNPTRDPATLIRLTGIVFVGAFVLIGLLIGLYAFIQVAQRKGWLK